METKIIGQPLHWPSIYNDPTIVTQANTRLMALFSELKIAAPQLKPKDPWCWLMAKIIEGFKLLAPDLGRKQGLGFRVSSGYLRFLG
jgi:hypothetical protein